jgi:hypothetical protein
MADERDDERVPSTPSTLDLDRPTRTVRGGRNRLNTLNRERTQTDTELAGGDVDADVHSAYAVGDETPAGENPTPDQDVVEEIGEAVGLVYQDTEQLGGEGKFEERDRHRWELDPASSDDYDARQRDDRRRPNADGVQDSGEDPELDDEGDEHIGATEDQVAETPAPSGDEFKDEPKQG